MAIAVRAALNKCVSPCCGENPQAEIRDPNEFPSPKSESQRRRGRGDWSGGINRETRETRENRMEMRRSAFPRLAYFAYFAVPLPAGSSGSPFGFRISFGLRASGFAPRSLRLSLERPWERGERRSLHAAGIRGDLASVLRRPSFWRFFAKHSGQMPCVKSTPVCVWM